MTKFGTRYINTRKYLKLFYNLSLEASTIQPYALHFRKVNLMDGLRVHSNVLIGIVVLAINLVRLGWRVHG